MSIESFISALPKAELHLHLEGAIQPETLLKLAENNKVKLPFESNDELNQLFKFKDFNQFIEAFSLIYKCLLTEDDFELITYDLAVHLKSQNVRYAELSFCPSAHDSRGIAPSTYLEGLKKGRDRAFKELGLRINWIFDISRHREKHYADSTTGLAIDCQDDGVLALGLSGKESEYLAEGFAEYFERASKAGLKSAPHAGELSGPESVWAALNSLKANRIAHGVRAYEDPLLIKHLKTSEISLAICPTSNICLGVYPNLKAHPLPQLHAAGLKYTINTDDPPFFNTTLNQEMELLHSCLGLDSASIEKIVLNGISTSFLPEQQKRELTMAFESEIRTLREIHLN